jgi:hypothetical protein
MSRLPDLLPQDAEWEDKVKIYKRRWNARNSETHRDQTRAWRLRNPENVEGYQQREKQRREWLNSLPLTDPLAKKHRAAAMFHDAKKRAKRDGMCFEIAREDIQIPDACPVFGTAFTHTPGRRTDSSPSLDRINNNLGYVRGNVMVVSWLANRIKSDATLDQLRTVADFYGSR